MKFGIFVSDAKPLPPGLLDKAASFLQQHDITCCIDERVYTAETAKQKAAIINDYYRDPSINALMAFWGGIKSIEILPYLDAKLIAQSIKPMVGYSDTTALLLVVSNLGAPAIHGSALVTFAKPTHGEEALVSLKQALAAKQYQSLQADTFNCQSDLSKKPVLRASELAFYRAGSAKGNALAGNLQTLLLLNGTDQQMDLAGKILFIEEAEEANEDYFRRFFSQLCFMKDFRKIKGLVMSNFTLQSAVTNQGLIAVLDEYKIHELDIPIIIGYNSGHCDPVLSVPMNAPCSISGDEKPVITFYDNE